VSYLYQEHGTYFAQIAHPIEDLGGEELSELGASNIEPGYRGVHFEADAASLYDIVYQSRIPTRILAPLMTFDCHSDRYLYRRASEIDWVSLIGVDKTLAIFATVSNSRLRHSKYAALKLKDAIVDQIRDATGSRPSIDRHHPDVWLNLHIENNRATISLDAAGRSMHRRGYRLDALEAPLQETVAAAIIRMSGWQGTEPLLDPMCGSGTILAEAMMAAAHIPSGYLHKDFGFEQLPDFDATLWEKRRSLADEAILPVEKGLISGSDIEEEALQMARRNLARLPGGENVGFEQSDFNDISEWKDGVIITNPPYGLRVGNRIPIEPFFKSIGDFLKQRCTNSTAYIYVGKPALLKSVGLRTTWKKELVNGALEGRLAKYDLY
jgi:putative N6-adenine-specific DNA methylase